MVDRQGSDQQKKQLASQIREAQRETDQLGCVSNVKWLRMAVKTVFFPRFFPTLTLAWVLQALGPCP